MTDEPVRDESEPLPVPGMPAGPGRHGIRWTAATVSGVLALYQGSQVFLTADTAPEVAFRATFALTLAWVALALANRWYRPEGRR